MASGEKQAVADLFSRTSTEHDSVGSVFAHFGSLLVERAGLHVGDQVLDVGAGTGASLPPAAEVVGPSGHVVGIDLAPGMVRVLNQRVAAGGMENAEALVGDGDSLPFADQSFDAVVCAFTLFFFPNPAKALVEFRRVLRDGGRVAISTFTKAGSTSIDRTWELISAYLPVPPATAGARFDEAQQLMDALGAAGFVGIVVDEADFEVKLPSSAALLAWLRSMEFRDHVDRLDPEQEAGLLESAQLRFAMDALITTAIKG